MSIMKVIHEIRRSRGRNKKLRILEDYRMDYEWMQFLVFTYDSSINYYVSAPAESTFKDDCEVEYKLMFKDLRFLMDRNVTGIAARQFAQRCSEKYGEAFRLVLSKSVKAGISVKSINAAYPGHIREFLVILGEDVPIPSLPVLGSTKYDGIRGVLYVNSEMNLILFYLRSGTILNLPSLIKDAIHLGSGWYDGELIFGTGRKADRPKITSAVNKVLKGTAKDIKDYRFMVFDWIPLEEWPSAYKPGAVPFKDRMLYKLRYDTYKNNIGKVHRTIIHTCRQAMFTSEKDIHNFYLSHIEEGYEGVMLRYPHHPYEWKRTKNIIKKKEKEKCVLTCIGVKEGKNKYEGLIGSLVCRGVVKGKRIEVNVAGLKEVYVEMDPEEVIGRRIEVTYNSIVKAKDHDHYSLFLPRLKRLLGDMNV